MSENESEYRHVMAFVTTADHGGPHDGRSYVCGYEMGVFDRDLTIARAIGALPGIHQIHSENLPQADLIAMRNRYTMLVERYEEAPEWCEVSFEPQAIDPEPGDAA